MQELVERHRLHIDRWSCPWSVEMQVGLADMCVADPCFVANYEKGQPGMATFLRDAVRICAGLPAAEG